MADGADPRFLDHLAAMDGVIFDASRPWLSAWALKENESDDYAQFMAAMIDPLARAGPAVIVLDNTGHEEHGRARGSSSKLDLHDLTFNVRQTRPFDERRTGTLQVTPGVCRFSPGGPWRMDVGGGAFGEVRDVEPTPTIADRDLHGAVVDVLRGRVVGFRKLIDELRAAGWKFRDAALREALAAWISDPTSPIDEVPSDGRERRYTVPE
jgi:hypothetical protein